MSVLPSFITKLQLSIENNDFIKLSLGNYKGQEANLKNIYIKLVLLKRVPKLSFTFRYKTRDITKNFEIDTGIAQVTEYLSTGFGAATLFTTAENLVAQLNKKGAWFVKSEKPTATKLAGLSHDQVKERKVVGVNKRYLQDLRLMDANGQVYNAAQDKWKQINHYIELLSTALQAIPAKEQLQVVDMGAGKGYLTFALYDFLNNTLHKNAQVLGVEYRQDLVDLCNTIAENASFANLGFVQGTIEDYKPAGDLDILIALHACDTATDDALFKGITHNADLIVVAPCCHKQVRRELERIKAVNDLDFLTKHGIFMERHAEMLTDGIRSLILEYYGYQTKVMQFVSDAHTAKNVMILAVKKQVDPVKQREILDKIKAVKAYYGIEYQHLERLCGLGGLV
ncbi:class I SAM-dependent methyltransferase [Sphingobacterium sp. Mn56C]|uniref:class I SAM-dependent methyltransferase n=1 Tax=Sphingobacterium sp. Mn56C TaxID=3395261 RepID=UPI003BBDBA09